MKRNPRCFRCLNAACLFAFLLFGVLNRSASAQTSAGYALQTLKATPSTKHRHVSDVVFRLYNIKTQKTVWTRTIETTGQSAVWSRDKRAVAINTNLDRFLVWSLGYRTRFFRNPPHEDYGMGFLWSPDKRRLLVRAGYSGMDMTPVTDLWCFNIPKRRLYLIAKSASNEVWASNRKVLYKIPDYNPKTGQWAYPKKFRVWYSP